MLLTLLFHLMTVLQVVQSVPQKTTESYLLETALTNGSIGAILFVIWFLTFKFTQRQFEFALKQNQDQFDKALKQIEIQHRENLEESRRTNDKLFEVIRKDAEYKEVLAGVLTEMKKILIEHQDMYRRG
ncbi:MAG: hypothetical protein HYS25_00945 [Ignavibacteriales bacterium]|nr:hypothetical protein [Ignavibacteriales bacterium]